jgi:hypothetical protein
MLVILLMGLTVLMEQIVQMIPLKKIPMSNKMMMKHKIQVKKIKHPKSM